MKLKNLKISRQLNLGLGFILIFVLLLCTISLLNSVRLWQNTKELYEHPLITTRAIGSIQTDILYIRLEMNGLILVNNAQNTQERRIVIDTYEADAFQQMDILYASYLGPKNDIDNAYNSIVQYKPIRDETIRLLQAGNIIEAAQRVKFDGVGGVQLQKVMDDLSIITDFALAQANQFYMDAQQQKNQNILNMIITFVVILILSVTISILLVKSILRPLKELTMATEAFRQGKLEIRSRYESTNEFGTLSSAFNTMTDTVQSEIRNKEKGLAELIISKEKAETANEIASKAEKYSRSLIEASLDPLVTIGLNGIITDVNKATEKTTGLPREELIGTDFAQYFTEPDRAQSGYQQAFIDGEVYDYELELKHIDGFSIPVLYNASVYKDDKGEIIGLFAAARDITSTRKFENELIYLKDNLEILVKNGISELTLANKELAFQNEEKEKRAAELFVANKELAIQNATIDEMNDQLEFRVSERTSQLESANVELESLSYSISHDLKAPLRHITGYISLLIKKYSDILPEESRKYLSNISFSANNMGELIDGLLQFSRTGRISMNQTIVDMNSIVADLISPIKEQDFEHRIEFHIDQMPTAFGDIEMIKSVWGNLIENAIKFSKKRDLAKISIGAEVTANEVAYFIKDNGAGFDMKYASKLFAVFQRLHSREDYEGTGIGLATVQRVITRHGGKIRAEAKVGEGAAFYFSLNSRKEKG